MTAQSPPPPLPAMSDADKVKEVQAYVEKGYQLKLNLDPANPEDQLKEQQEIDKNQGILAEVQGKLKTDAERGLKGDETDLVQRRETYGANYCPPPDPESIFALMYEALKDVTIIMLLCCGVIELPLGIAFHEEEDPAPGWIEGVALLGTVAVVVVVNGFLDFKKQMQFRALNAANEGALACALYAMLSF